MGFQMIYFKSWKIMLWKCWVQYACKFGKLSSGQRTGKGQFSFQSQFSSVQSLSCARLFATPWTVACTRLLHPWDFLGKSTGVGCHFLLLSILLHCLSLELEWKLTFSSPVATTEFSKFAGILSAALSQHHLSGFETAQLEFHHLH